MSKPIRSEIGNVVPYSTGILNIPRRRDTDIARKVSS
jgi:hypothetical protein